MMKRGTKRNQSKWVSDDRVRVVAKQLKFGKRISTNNIFLQRYGNKRSVM